MTWIPLHCHSQYSILDASISIFDLVRQAKEYKIPSLALTDHGNMYGAIDFYKECKSQNIHPILGAELYLAPRSRFEKKKDKSSVKAYNIVLLCKNSIGYRNLCHLSSLGFLEGFYYYPRIDKELLEKYSEGLICLSGSFFSSIGHNALISEEALTKETLWFQKIFKDDFYLEIQRHPISEEKLNSVSEEWVRQEYKHFSENQDIINKALLKLAKSHKIKYIATNDIHYLKEEDWLCHEILLNIQSGETLRTATNNTYVPNPKRKIYKSREFYFKSPEEMMNLFSDCPEAISTTLEVAEKCQVSFDFSLKHYPIYIPPGFDIKNLSNEQERYKASSEYLKQLCQEGLKKKYNQKRLEELAKKFPNDDPLTLINNRLNWELDIIISKGMTDYLLIVWDIINWAKSQNIPIGPGRGSGAGSVILFLINITSVEPLRFDLFFERFINPERISYPDIDIDICMEGRERVINYTIQKYGLSNVAQIITFGTMKAKMAIKDVGRVLNVPLSQVNLITKYIPDQVLSLKKALEIDSDLQNIYNTNDDSRTVIDLALKLEGSIRNTGVHAAGIIICGDPLMERIPICMPKETSMRTTQYSMKPVEMVGMLKMDFLGLKTLTTIHLAIKFIEQRTGILLDWMNCPLDDIKTFELLQQGKTLGVFQMESSGMQELSRQLLPDKFEEIIAIGALYRPGPMDMIPTFINRKHGREIIEYDHPLIENILKETYGIMVYQEQVMQIAQTMANYSLGEGDVLRRAMGKKDAEQMKKEREKFCARALENQISKDLSTAIFDKMEKFASYGFNKSHAAAYGLITYITAYLKANYCKEWLAALLTCDQNDIDKVAKIIHESTTLNIPILPPDINESETCFFPTDSGIRFAMTCIKGVGHGIVDSIIEERKKNGFFKDFYDFIQRIQLKKIGKKVIENLIDAGCFNYTSKTRDELRTTFNSIYDRVLSDQQEAASGILTFFPLIKDTNIQNIPITTIPEKIINRTNKELFQKEKELLGVYLTEHPLDSYKKILTRLSCISFSLFPSMPHGSVVRAAFIIDHVTIKLSSRDQRKFAILRISDGVDFYELPIWPEVFSKHSSLLEENQLIYAILIIDKREQQLKLSCKWLEDLTTMNEETLSKCDEIYDKIKMKLANSSFLQLDEKKNTIGKKLSTKKTSKQKPLLEITLNIEKIKFSHILKLKRFFEKQRGPTSIKLSFTFKGNHLGIIHVGNNLTVDITNTFFEELNSYFPDINYSLTNI